MTNQKSRIKIFDRDTLKYAALVTMAVGHLIGYLPFILQFISDETARRGVFLTLVSFADFAPPIFFFFISEGFIHSRSRKKYAVRLLLFTIISQVPYCLMKYGTITLENFFGNWNVLATLFMGLIGLFVWNSKMSVFISKIGIVIKALIIVLIDAFTMLIRSEWTVFGVPMILGFYIFRNKEKIRTVWFCSLVVIQQFIYLAYCGFDLGVMFSRGYPIQMIALLLGYFVITKLYNGEKGKHPVFSKWFFYIFFPVHMLIIFLMKRAFRVR